MTHKVQRNAPCPCGSGLKYKKCCMLKEKDESNCRYDHREGVQHALVWLNQHHRAQIDQWVEQFWFQGMSEAQRHGVATADAQIRAIHDVNVLELLLAEGRFSDLESEPSPLALVLNHADEVGLNANQLQYLQQLPQYPLRLCRVQSCTAGESFAVVDVLTDEVFDIHDAMGSRMFEVGELIGLRVIDVLGAWETSGAIYYIPEAYHEAVVDEVKACAQEQVSLVLAQCWLRLVAAHV